MSSALYVDISALSSALYVEADRHLHFIHSEMFVLILLLAALLFGGFFLAMFGQPAGWILLALGAIGLMIALIRGGVDWGRWSRPRPHGAEDRRRGTNRDPMQ